MKLLDDLFVVLHASESNAGFTATIELDPNHLVYLGHFPGHPVTPAVIQMQIVHELLESYFGKALKLIRMDGCKFLKVLNPEETPRVIIHVQYKLSGEVLNIKAWGESDGITFFKLSSVYQFV